MRNIKFILTDKTEDPAFAACLFVEKDNKREIVNRWPLAGYKGDMEPMYFFIRKCLSSQFDYGNNVTGILEGCFSSDHCSVIKAQIKFK